MTQEQAMSVLKLKYAAQDVSDNALVLFHTETDFHKDNLMHYASRLESALANLKREME